jgi:hypothetical protein
MEVRYRAPRNKFWNYEDLPKGEAGKITAAALFGMVESSSSSKIVDDDWQASLEVKFIEGTTRTVNVDTLRSLTMSFPVLQSDQKGTAKRPDGKEFQQACVDALALFKGQFGVRGDVAQHVEWESEWEPPANVVAWKVDWHELSTDISFTS